MAVNIRHPDLLGGYQKGLNIRATREEMQARESEREREEKMRQAMESVSGDNDPMSNDLFSTLPIEKQNMIRQGITLDANLDANQQKMRYNAMFKDLKLAENLLDNGLEAETVSLLQDRAQNTDYGQDTAEILQAYQTGGAPALKKYLNAFNSLASDGKSKEYKPEISTPQTAPDGQQYVIITDPNTQETKRVNVKGGKVETGDQKMDRDIKKDLLKQSIEVSKDAFGSLKKLRSNISTYDDAIKALNKGASTGVIEQYLPSFQQSTIELENAAQRLGLDVISATTFGALSEGELRLAMSTAVPMSLEPEQLKGWLKDKKAAQQKLGKELRSMAITLGRGKMTIAEYLDKSGYSTQSKVNEGNVVDWNDL